MHNFKVSELTLDNIGIWPLSVKVALAIILFFLILVAGFLFDTMQQWSRIKVLHLQEKNLLRAIDFSHSKTGNLKEAQEQLTNIKQVYQEYVNNFSLRLQMPDLFAAITAAGARNQLEFKQFKPEHEVEKEFFSETPIQISAVGDYHNLAKFLSDMTHLKPMVALGDFSFSALDKPNSLKTKKKLLLKITLVTYGSKKGVIQ